MKEKIKRFFSNGWTIAIGSGIILLVIPSIAKSWFSNISFIDAVKWLFSAIGRFLFNILTFGIPVYALLILAGLLLFVRFLFSKRTKKQEEPGFLTYTDKKYKH